MNDEPLIRLTDTKVIINFTCVPDIHGVESFNEGHKKQKQLEKCIEELQAVVYDLYNRAVLK